MDVVSGVLVNSLGDVLMGKRKPTKLRPSLWELPGGKIEPGETPEQALRREWMEELQLDATVAPTIPGMNAAIADSTLVLEQGIRIRLYEVNARGVAVATDHDDLIWTHPQHAVMSLPCSPGFYLQFDALRTYLRVTRRWVEWRPR